VRIAQVSAPDAAADPKHPDHDRWVKEQTLAIEVAHAQRIGKSFRDAETENNRLLQRMEALARAEKPKAAPKPRKSRQQRMLERAVEVREALPVKPAFTWLNSSPCGRCGLCRACRREKRILAISHRATKQREPWALQAMWGITLVILRWKGRTGEFRGLNKTDADRRITAEAERICDESARHMGRWAE
jgi:hypothetical protein